MKNKEILELMKNESFTLTEKAVDLIIKIVSIRYILENDKPNKEQKVRLEEEKEKLLKQFFKEFQKKNPKQVKMFQEYKKQKNKEDK